MPPSRQDTPPTPETTPTDAPDADPANPTDADERPGGGAAGPPAGMAPDLSDPEVMRRLGYRAVDHLVARWAGLEEDRPWQTASAQETRVLLHRSPPEEGTDPEGVEALMDEAVQRIFPLSGRIDHPRFLGFVPSAPSWPSVLADVLVSGHNVFQGTWLESAGPSQVELTVLDWFRQWLGMPDGASGVLTSGGSAANLLAVVTAREVAGWPADPVMYVSDQGHNSLRKARRIAGLRPHQIRVLPTGPDRLLNPDRVREALATDRAAGRTPILICANGGATNTGTVDPLDALADLSRAEGVRLHVDAAYGGFAILTPGGAEALAGLGRADSVTLDPHKWLFQSYECGCLMVRDPQELETAMRASAEYLQDTETRDGEVNFGDRSLQLTRSFRALKIWLSVQALGRRAMAEAIGDAMELAERTEAWIRDAPELELLHPAALSVVCFRFRPGGDDDRDHAEQWSEERLEKLNTRIQDHLLEDGHAMVSSTRLAGRYSLRFCILNPRTRWRHLREILEEIVDRGRHLVEMQEVAR